KWLEMFLRRRFEEEMRKFSEAPDFEHLERVNELLSVVFLMPVQVNLWTAQNIYYDMLMSIYPDMLKCEESGEKDVRAKDIRAKDIKEWIEGFLHLGQRLFFNIEEITRF
ncbi:hypothetical protein MNBD_NITROSPIRAE03-1587, partial [hydrothermal vent metagenome]